MKFFVTAIFLILGPFSFIELVHSLECYQTVNVDTVECEHEGKKKRHETNNLDETYSTLFACFRDKMEERKGSSCETEACSTVIFELKDQTQWMVKDCATATCEDYKTVDTTFPGDFVKDTHCDFCSSDNCNNQKPKSNPRLPSQSAVAAPPPADQKPKNNPRLPSQSAVAAPPPAAVFILVSIIHNILL